MFSVSEAILVRRNGTEYNCYFILEEGIPVYEINKWLEYKGMNSLATSKKYAFQLCRFLNFLKNRNKVYRKANRRDILTFVDYLLFAKEESTVISFQSQITYQTATSYLTVIKEFYRFVEDVSNEQVSILRSSNSKRISTEKYLYGQIWDIEIKELLATKMPRVKESKEHIKWYSEEDIEAILTQFNTLRDRSIFYLTLEGMRISEVINLNMEDYSQEKKLIHIKRAKGQKERIVPLRKQTILALESYLYSERSLLEEELGLFEAIFVNLRKGKKYGNRVEYRNILTVIKNAADRAGLDKSMVRTHSGRSTRTMELLRFQSEHPEENLTDEQIRLLMGWSSSKSIEPYINQKDEKTLISLAEKINSKGVEED